MLEQMATNYVRLLCNLFLPILKGSIIPTRHFIDKNTNISLNYE